MQLMTNLHLCLCVLTFTMVVVVATSESPPVVQATPSPTAMQHISCEAHSQRDQCISGYAGNSTVCLWCGEERSCLEVRCFSNFWEFSDRCGSIGFNKDKCGRDDTLNTRLLGVSIFSVLVAFNTNDRLQQKQQYSNWRAGVLLFAYSVVMAGIVVCQEMIPEFPPTIALLIVGIPLVVAVVYLVCFPVPNIDHGVELAMLLASITSGVFFSLLLVQLQTDHFGESAATFPLSLACCLVWVFALFKRDDALYHLWCAPLQPQRSERVVMLIWVMVVLRSMFWSQLHKSLSTLHMLMAVSLQVLFLRHELGRTGLKVIMGLLFGLELSVCVATFVFELDARIGPNNEEVSKALLFASSSLALVACCCFAVHFCSMKRGAYSRRYAEHFGGKRLLWELLLPDVARLVEEYAGHII